MQYARGIALAAIAGVLLAAPVSSSASAATAPAKPKLTIAVANYTVAPGTDGKSEYFWAHTDVPYDSTDEQATVTIDSTGLAGFATATKENSDEFECETAGAVQRCRVFLNGLGPDWRGLMAIQVAPLPGAKVGQQGTFAVTLSAPGLQAATVTAKATIAEGVNLSKVGDTQQLTRKVGASLPVQLGVQNTGTTVVNGVTLDGYFDAAFEHTKRYSNCVYFRRSAFRCHFDTALAVGARYKVSLPLRVASDTWAPSQPYAEYLWRTPADQADADAMPGQWPPGEPGTDGKLKLVRDTSTKLAAGQTDTAPDDNWNAIALKVTGKQSANFSATGAIVRGSVGDVVPAKIGVVNHGPARRDWGRWGEPAQSARVDIPSGATATSAPKTCVPWVNDDIQWDNPGKPGARTYLCRTESYQFDVAETATFDFALRIDSAASSRGSVAINLKPGDFNNREVDLKPADDTAQLLLNPAAGGAGSAPELPQTGTDARSLAATGAALLLLGVGLVLTVRRRREGTRDER